MSIEIKTKSFRKVVKWRCCKVFPKKELNKNFIFIQCVRVLGNIFQNTCMSKEYNHNWIWAILSRLWQRALDFCCLLRERRSYITYPYVIQVPDTIQRLFICSLNIPQFQSQYHYSNSSYISGGSRALIYPRWKGWGFITGIS